MRSKQEVNASPAIIERATLLAYIGLLPFLLTSILLWLYPSVVSWTTAASFLSWVTFYAALVLSFLGGIRWGFALYNVNSIKNPYVGLTQLTNSVIPPLIGWLMVTSNNIIPGFSPNYFARHVILLFAFWCMWFFDQKASAEGFTPRWYGNLRQKVTFFLTLIYILILMRLYSLGW